MHAEMDFWASKIDLKIQEHLVASSYENSVEQFTHFIMATDIGLFILTSVKTISYQAFTSIVSFFHWKECKEKSIGLKRFKTSLKLPCKCHGRCILSSLIFFFERHMTVGYFTWCE